MINQIRIPRPLGITYLCIQMNKEVDEKKRTKLKERILTTMIDQYVANGFMLDGRNVPFDVLANFLNIEIGTLMRLSTRSMERIANIFEGEEGKAFARVNFFRAINWVLESCESIKSQSLLLKAEQGEKYVPFLTAELNRSLASQSQAIKPMIDLLKLLTEKNPTNILIQNIDQKGTRNVYVTATEAAKMIEQNGTQSMLLDNSIIDAELAEELPSFPEVGAKYQDLNSIGIRYSGLPGPSINPLNPD